MKLPIVLCTALLVLAIAAHGRAAGLGDPTGALIGTITIGGRPTSDVVVWIEGLGIKPAKGASGAEYYRSHARIGQRDLRFFPHVVPIMVGGTVEFTNEDKVWHNVFSTSKTKTFDLGLYAPGESRKETFDKPGVVQILCNVHPEMSAYVLVLDNPYFASPDERGNYRFEGLPLGSYWLKVWRPSADVKTEPFTIERAGEVARIDEDF